MTDSMSATTQEIPRVRDLPAHHAAGVTQQVPFAAVHSGPAPVDSMHAPTQEVPIVAGGVPPAWQRPAGKPDRFTRMLYAIRDSPAWIAPTALLVCFLSAASFVVISDPTDDLGPTTCAFKMVTGFDCPGCGGTRAFYYVLTFNLPEAARNHVIAVFAAPFLVYLYASWALRRVFPRVRWRFPSFRLTPLMATYFMIGWAAFWVLRNIPWPPFTALYV
jgi:hypothetical protein